MSLLSTNHNMPSTTVAKKFTFKKKEKKSPVQKTIKFKVQNPIKSNKHYTFRRKHKSIFEQFVHLCQTNNIAYFQFYDQNSWTGPAIKISENDFDTVDEIFENSSLDIIKLNGYGFIIIRPYDYDTVSINYPIQNYDSCKFTQSPIIPYNSDIEESDNDKSENDTSDSDESDSDNDEYFEIEDEFIAEEWKYDGVIYLLDPKTNLLYFPGNLEFIGKKTSEFSIDFEAKER